MSDEIVGTHAAPRIEWIGPADDPSLMHDRGVRFLLDGLGVDTIGELCGLVQDGRARRAERARLVALYGLCNVPGCGEPRRAKITVERDEDGYAKVESILVCGNGHSPGEWAS